MPGQTEHRMGQTGDRDGDREQDQGLGQNAPSRAIASTVQPQSRLVAPRFGPPVHRQEDRQSTAETNQRDDERCGSLRWRRVRAPRDHHREDCALADCHQDCWPIHRNRDASQGTLAPGSIAARMTISRRRRRLPLDRTYPGGEHEPIDLFGARSGATVMRELAVPVRTARSRPP